MRLPNAQGHGQAEGVIRHARDSLERRGMNFLEQLISEWYSYQGYYVRTNVKVGRREAGGYEGELDVVAFHPETREIVHIETSMDALSWNKRREKFARKFKLGQRYIPELFSFAKRRPTQVAVFGFPRTTRNKQLLGEDVKVYLMPRLVEEIAKELSKTTIETGAIPEIFPLLRAMQFALDYGGYLKAARSSTTAEM